MPDPSQAVRSIEAELRAAGTPERAEQERRYLKSRLEHWGATVPAIRRAALAPLGRRPGREEALALAEALWAAEVHERRMAATVILEAAADGLLPEDLPLVEGMIREARAWAYVDGLAVWAAGTVVARHPEAAPVADRWAADEDLWLRRSALLCLLPSLRAGDREWARFGRLADGMLHEREFFVRKAIGWVLREVGRRRPDDVIAWLEPRAARASGLTVREAVRHLPAPDRERILAARG